MTNGYGTPYFIRHTMNSKEKYTTERLDDDYRKMFKSDLCIIYCDKGPPAISMDMFDLIMRRMYHKRST